MTWKAVRITDKEGKHYQTYYIVDIFIENENGDAACGLWAPPDKPDQVAMADRIARLLNEDEARSEKESANAD